MPTIKNSQISLYCQFNKTKKDFEPVSTLQHWAKNMLESFVIEQTSIWPNVILIVLRIQKK